MDVPHYYGTYPGPYVRKAYAIIEGAYAGDNPCGRPRYRVAALSRPFFGSLAGMAKPNPRDVPRKCDRIFFRHNRRALTEREMLYQLDAKQETNQ